jgi:hypothetical protein
MDLLLCWLIAPAGLLLATIGLSLLVERLAGFVLPWAVRPALGLALAIVIAQFGTATDFTAGLTLPAILLVSVAGLVVGRRLPERRPSGAEVSVAVGVFLLYSSPFLVIGEATLAGYIKLDDTATWLALTDHVFEFGRGLGDLGYSTHREVLGDYLGGSYPIGSFVPMALMSKLSGQDIAFTIQPSMAFAAATMALLVFELGRRLVVGVSRAVLIAILSSLASLLVGYYLWGGVKEMVVAALLPLTPLLAACAAGEQWPRRAWAPLGLAVAAMVVVLGPGGAVWAVPTLLPAAVAVWRRSGARRLIGIVGPLAAFSILLILPVVFTPTGIFDPFIDSSLTEGSELGNLAGPLNFFQLAGIWPAIDFRLDPHLKPAVIALAATCLFAATATVAVAYRRGERDGVPLTGYVVGGALGALAIAYFGSPWVDAKAMAALSPALLAAALIGLFMLGQRTPFRIEAAVLVLLVGGAVVWSAFLAYQGVWFAPRSHFTELEEIGDRFAGEGPALGTEVSIYGPRHFLRKLDAVGAADNRSREVGLTRGGVPEKGEYVDLDRIAPAELDAYALLVVRRSAAESRPPADFGLAYQTDHYDVWRRRPAPGTLLEHLPLGTELDAGDVPECSAVRRLAEEAGSGGKLVAARVGTPVAIGFSADALPSGWTASWPYAFVPSGSGTLSEAFEVPGGVYELWLAGSVFGGLDLRFDGEEVASERAKIDNTGGYEPFGPVRLSAGTHWLEAEYEGSDLSPGSAAQPWGIGPIELDRPQPGDLGTVTAGPAEYGRLCGRRWDWVEAYS